MYGNDLTAEIILFLSSVQIASSCSTCVVMQSSRYHGRTCMSLKSKKDRHIIIAPTAMTAQGGLSPVDVDLVQVSRLDGDAHQAMSNLRPPALCERTIGTCCLRELVSGFKTAALPQHNLTGRNCSDSHGGSGVL